MRKRKLLVALGVAALLIVALPVVVLLAIGDDPRVASSDLDRVQTGMTLAEVESIFGGPAPRSRPYPPGVKRLIWDGYEGHAGVTFDATGSVIDKSYTPGTRETRRDLLTRRLDRLRAWWTWWRLRGIRE